MLSPKWFFAAVLIISTTFVATLARIAFDWFVEPGPAFLIPFFLPVVVTALYLGGRWGSLATILNAAIVAYFFTPPVFSFAIQTVEDQIRIASFVVLGSVLVGLAGSLRSYRLKAEDDARLVQKKIVEALQDSEQKFRAVFHAQFQFIGLMSPDGVLLEANQAALEAAGLPEDTVIGKPFWETAWWSHDPIQQQRLRDAVHHAAAGHRDRFEASHPRADGGIMWVDFSLTPYFQDGRVVLLIPEGRDITERKQAEAAIQESEQRFQSFMMHAPIAAWIVDAESRGVYTSPGFDKHLGLPPREFYGRIPSDLWPAEIAEAYVENNRRVLAEGVVETEEPFVRTDETTGVAHIVKFPMSGLRGEQLIGGVAIDITVRKNAEASLKASEERFRSAFEFAPIGMALVAPDGKWLRVNRSVCETLGYTEQELLATDFQMITHPDDLESDLRFVRKLLDGSIETYQMEKRYFHKLGNVVYALLSVTLARDSLGRPLHFISQIKDITIQKIAERAMEANDALLRQFIKHSPAAIAMFDRKLCYIQASDRWLSDYRLGSRDIVGVSHYELFPDIPDRWKEVHKRVLAGAVEGCEEDRFHHADGSAEWLQWECRPWHDANGEIGGITMFAQVITERKRVEAALKLSEERFRRLVDGVADHAIFMLDKDGYVLSWNPGAQQIKGYTTDEIRSRHFSIFYTPDAVSAGHPEKELATAMAEGRYQEEGIRVRKDGSHFWADVTISTLYDDLGQHVGFVKFTHDISERKASEKLLRESLKEKEVMLKEIHHRVKNNLQIVSALLELQSGHTSSQAVLQMFEESQARVKSMALIHERLYKSGDFAGVDFGEYVRQLADDLYRAYKVTDDEIELKLDVNIPLVPIDIAIPCGLLLNELISNCLKHAFKSSTRGCIRVSLSNDGQVMVLSVSDDGGGFGPDIDFRNSTSFGLQLVSTLVEQLNGEAEMSTSPGTKFTVRFRN